MDNQNKLKTYVSSIENGWKLYLLESIYLFKSISEKRVELDFFYVGVIFGGAIGNIFALGIY